MALIQFTFASEVRGSINGQTFSRNRGGAYVRNRSIPVQPGGQLQQATRQAISVLSSRWRDVLSDEQRDGWDAYALATPLPNSLGAPRNVGGLGMYVRGNATRVQAGLVLIDDAPAFGIPEIGDVQLQSIAGAALTFSFDDTKVWTGENNAHLVVFVSRPVSPARNFFKGPYRRFAIVNGSSTTPATSPGVGAWPFQMQIPSGARLFTRAIVLDQLGRASDSATSTFVIP